MNVARPDLLVLDSSALFLPFEKRIDLEKEAQRLLPGTKLIVPRPIIEEVAYLAAGGSGSSKRMAKMALTYLIRFEEFEIGGRGDDAVIQTGRELEKQGFNVGVATADQGLRGRARAKGWPVLTVRGHRAFLDGYVD